MRKRFGLTLKIKIIFLLILLLGSSLAFFTSFSVNLFKKDKAAYIYETSLSTTETIQGRLDQYLAKTARDFQLIDNILSTSLSKDKKPIAHQVLLSNQEPIIYSRDNVFLKNKKNIDSQRLTEEQLNDFRSLLKNDDLKAISKSSNGIEIKVLTSNNQTYFLLTNKRNRSALLINSSQILIPIEESKIYDSKLVSVKGNFSFPKSATNYDMGTISDILSTSSITKTVKESIFNGEKYLLSYSKLRSFDFYIISLIKHNKAFKAATFLSRKSLYFGIIVLASGIILGVFFSRSLTKPLESLYHQTLKVAAGDFEGKVVISSRDEIGSLSHSFNFMTSEILRYMTEMKEKVRLENEVAVAQLVQKSFFPPLTYDSKRIELSAFYTPASECGGDWFHVTNLTKKTIIIMADATGHGVPAALLTAAIYTAFNSLAELHKESLTSSRELLENINNIICTMETNLYLTSFVAIIDEETGEMVYSNASHMEPFLIHRSESKYTKADLIPIIDAKGPRLGHKRNSKFPENKIQLLSGDTMVILTDGVFESTNNEGQQYGQRSFIKSLCNHLEKPTIELQNSLISDLKDFCKDHPYDDDVTLMVVRDKS